MKSEFLTHETTRDLAEANSPVKAASCLDPVRSRFQQKCRLFYRKSVKKKTLPVRDVCPAVISNSADRSICVSVVVLTKQRQMSFSQSSFE